MRYTERPAAGRRGAGAGPGDSAGISRGSASGSRPGSTAALRRARRPRRRTLEQRRRRRSNAFDLLAVVAALALVGFGLANLYLIGEPQLAARQGLIAAGGVAGPRRVLAGPGALPRRPGVGRLRRGRPAPRRRAGVRPLGKGRHPVDRDRLLHLPTVRAGQTRPAAGPRRRPRLGPAGVAALRCRRAARGRAHRAHAAPAGPQHHHAAGRPHGGHAGASARARAVPAAAGRRSGDLGAADDQPAAALPARTSGHLPGRFPASPRPARAGRCGRRTSPWPRVGCSGGPTTPCAACARSTCPSGTPTWLSPAWSASGAWSPAPGSCLPRSSWCGGWRWPAGRPARRTARSSAGGLAILLGLETVVSVGGNLGLLPLAGVPFPLVSYGGTALVVHLAAIGVVLSVRQDGARRRLWAVPRWRNPRPRLVRLAAVALSVLLLSFGLYGWRLQTTQGEALRGVAQADDPLHPAARLPGFDHRPARRTARRERRGRRRRGGPGARDPRPAARTGRRTSTGWRSSPGRPPADLGAQLRAAAGTTLSLVVAEVPRAIGDAVTAAAIPGVLVVAEPRRTYPQGALLGPVLGFAGVATPDDEKRWPGLPPGEIVGRAGLEQEYDAVLRGIDGRQCVYVDPTGRPRRARRPAAPGSRRRPAALPRPGAAAAPGRRPRRGPARAAPAGRQGRRGRRDGSPDRADPRHGERPVVRRQRVRAAGRRRGAEAPGRGAGFTDARARDPGGRAARLDVQARHGRGQPGPPGARAPPGRPHRGRLHLRRPRLPQLEADGADGPGAVDRHLQRRLLLQARRRARPGRRSSTPPRRSGWGSAPASTFPASPPGTSAPRSRSEAKGGAWYGGSTVILGIGQGELQVTPLQNARWTAAVSTGNLVTPRLGLAIAAQHGLLHRAPRAGPHAAALRRISWTRSATGCAPP